MTEYKPPEDADLAAALGIERLGAGRQHIRDESRFAIASVHVNAVWVLYVEPSFHEGGLVGVATAQGEELRGKTSPSWVRGILASGGAMSVCELLVDPLPELIARVRLLDTHDGVSLDGVGYKLRTDTNAITATVTFSNPTIPALSDLAACALRLAKQLAATSGNQNLLAFVDNWGKYLGSEPDEGLKLGAAREPGPSKVGLRRAELQSTGQMRATSRAQQVKLLLRASAHLRHAARRIGVETPPFNKDSDLRMAMLDPQELRTALIDHLEMLLELPEGKAARRGFWRGLMRACTILELPNHFAECERAFQATLKSLARRSKDPESR